MHKNKGEDEAMGGEQVVVADYCAQTVVKARRSITTPVKTLSNNEIGS
jgi:hypothetical protein